MDALDKKLGRFFSLFGYAALLVVCIFGLFVLLYPPHDMEGFFEGHKAVTLVTLFYLGAGFYFGVNPPKPKTRVAALILFSAFLLPALMLAVSAFVSGVLFELA